MFPSKYAALILPEEEIAQGLPSGLWFAHRVRGDIVMIGRFLGHIAALLLVAVALAQPLAAKDTSFTIAVIPDTQNYMDYSHQKAEGFSFDASDQFLEQMRYIAANVESAGGDIAFVTAVGDVWQHQTLPIDPAHAARGFARVSNPMLDRMVYASAKVPSVEMPKAAEGYRLIAGKVPFSVVPGNHDYDAMWPVVPPKGADGKPKVPFMLHVGGLSNFGSVFGPQSDFFRGRPWYVGANDGGADSAQIFTAGGYRFLHIGVQFNPPNSTLLWVERIMRRYRGVPTIISTHDYLSTKGERLANPIIDPAAVDPEDNNAEALWQKLISRNDQIFLVLCGHQHGQSRRMDRNRLGNEVYQILADYQDRGQSVKDAGGKPAYTGDGWMRLMEFDMGGAVPVVRVRTYSTHYKALSGAMPQYAAWYRPHEQPKMSDAEFLAAEEFSLSLGDFRKRFDRRGRVR
jgi:3',5'-cyclic AMP phosphodiesterase CpdA